MFDNATGIEIIEVHIPKGANRVSFIHKQIELVLLLEAKKPRQVRDSAFHREEPFNDNHYLSPRTVCVWVALANEFSKETH